MAACATATTWASTPPRTLGEDAKALPLYERACAGGIRQGCFDVAGLLIKERATRKRGVQEFEKVCALPPGPAGGDQELERMRRAACRIVNADAPVRGAEYRDFAGQAPGESLFE